MYSFLKVQLIGMNSKIKRPSVEAGKAGGGQGGISWEMSGTNVLVSVLAFFVMMGFHFEGTVRGAGFTPGSGQGETPPLRCCYCVVAVTLVRGKADDSPLFSLALCLPWLPELFHA